jgi:PKD repeat protein
MVNGTPASSTSQNPSVTYNTAGTYTVTLVSSNSFGASSSVSQTVTVNPAPPTPTITQNGVVLTSSLASGDQWYLNGIVIAGDTLPADTANQSGIYKVIATNQFGCSASSIPVNITTTDINSIKKNDGFIIFPNPSNGIVTINFVGKSEHINVEVMNDLGQLAYAETVNDCQNNCNKTIDMTAFMRGIYLFRIVADGNTYTKKVLFIK